MATGNLKTKTKNSTIVTRYYYNAQNKLVKITGPNYVYQFLYDSQNRRIGIGKGPNDSSLIWRKIIHNGNIPIGELDSTNGVTRWFVRGLGIAEGTGDVIAEIDDSGDPHFYLSNHRSDTLVVLNDSGSEECQLQYDAFGNAVTNTGTFDPRYTFSTKEYLSDCQLYLYAYRAYDPIAGRWTQRDPIDYQDSINLYQFCGNNPVIIVDIFGLAAEKLNKETILNTIARAYKEKVIDAKLNVGKVINPIIIVRFAKMDSYYHERYSQIFSYDGQEYSGSQINYALFGAAYEATYAKLSLPTSGLQSGGRGGVEMGFATWVLHYNFVAAIGERNMQYIKDIPEKMYWAYWGRIHHKEIKERAMSMDKDKGADE